jgi:hypothetical protein
VVRTHAAGLGKVLQWLPIALVALAAVAVAWRLRWVCDDALTSFRYSRNWVNGHGLVFNPGEVVEAYTNFLWMALLAAGYAVGIDPPVFSVVLSLTSFLIAILASKSLVERVLGHATWVPLAAIAIGFCFPLVSFATSGLETMFCTTLVLTSVLAATRERWLLAGLLGIFATLGHPDHAIFYVALGVALVWQRTGWRSWVRYGTPFVVLYLPYFILRWRYFGYPFPNSYYTKSGGAWYLSQGAFYLFASMLVASLYALLPAAVVGIWQTRTRVLGKFAMIALPMYLGYVAKIGGDFMTARLLCPVLPILFVLAEVAVRRMLPAAIRSGALLVPMALVCIPTPLHKPGEYRWFLTDERTFYETESLVPFRLKGYIARRVHVLKQYLGGATPPPTYAAYVIGYLGWTTNWRIVDIHGLLDPVLSHQPLLKRGRPGHEREATVAHIVEQGADLSSKEIYPPQYARFSLLKLEEQTYWMVHYLPHLLAPLRGNPLVEFTDFPAYLDQYLTTAATLPAAQRQADLDFFEAFYFSVNQDAPRRQQLQAALAASRSPVPPGQ